MCSNFMGIGINHNVANTRHKSILLLFSPIFLSGNSFFPDLLCSIFYSKLSYMVSYLTVTSHTLYTSIAYTHHGEL